MCMSACRRYVGAYVAGLMYTHLTHKVFTLPTVDVPDVLFSKNLITTLDKGFLYFKIWFPRQRKQIVIQVKCERWERERGPA
jgi:hypothetical protein